MELGSRGDMVLEFMDPGSRGHGAGFQRSWSRVLEVMEPVSERIVLQVCGGGPALTVSASM